MAVFLCLRNKLDRRNGLEPRQVRGAAHMLEAFICEARCAHNVMTMDAENFDPEMGKDSM